MKAFILAAGNGTRLKPITNHKPKALVEINGVTLLERNIRRLMRFGFNDIIINVHHFADQIEKFVREKENFGINIEISAETNSLLDTGGGLMKASWFFDAKEPFIIHNVDILTDINLEEIYKQHAYSNVLATLAVRNRKSSRYLLFDKQNHLVGWKNANTKQVIMSKSSPLKLNQFAFSGVQVVSPQLFKQVKLKGRFSLIDMYLSLAKHNHIAAYTHDDTHWIDVGEEDMLKQAEKIADEII